MRKYFQTGLLPIVVMVSLSAQAGVKHDEGHGAGHGQPAQGMGEMDMSSMNMNSMDMSSVKQISVQGHAGMDMKGMNMDGMAVGNMGMGGHAHASWSEPPVAFADKTYDQWGSYAQASKGMNLYNDNCMGCHGVDGRGTGPFAKSLEHAPADLTNHFHTAAGKGDQYLYWRISEGGTVAPFVAMNSAMPAFKGMLSESQRWSILTYIHQAFHRGENVAAADMSAKSGMMGGHGQH